MPGNTIVSLDIVPATLLFIGRISATLLFLGWILSAEACFTGGQTVTRPRGMEVGDRSHTWQHYCFIGHCAGNTFVHWLNIGNTFVSWLETVG